MGNVTATGILSVPLELIRTHIAACAAFQSWVNEADATQAKKRVHIVAFDPDTKDWPFAHVYFTEDWQSVSIAGGAAFFFDNTRSVDVHFEAEVPAELADDPDDAMLDFLNNIGAIIEDMQEYAGQAGYAAITSIRQIEAPWRSDDDDVVTDGDIQGVTYRIEWGL